MENLINLTWLPSAVVYAILILLWVVSLAVIWKIVKTLVSKFLCCRASKVCKKICSYLPGECSCEGCSLEWCPISSDCSSPCLPVKIFLYVVSAVITLTVFAFIASIAWLPWVSAIIWYIIWVVGSVIAWFVGLAQTVLLLIPQAVAVYIAGRAIYKGPQFVYDEVYTFFVVNIKKLFKKATETVDGASDTVIEKLDI